MADEWRDWMPAELIGRLKENPKLLDQLSPEQFEQLVAELLAFLGWDINVPAQTRDPGYDILGVSRDATGLETSWLVECKRWAPPRKTGVDVVRRLEGTKTALGIPQALLVTSSQLTSEARQFATSRGLQIADRLLILDWLSRYKPRSGSRSHAAARRFYSCFVSYSHKDEEFVTKFVARLRVAGVRVWFAAEDLHAGKKIHEEVASAISTFDRLLVVLSSNSMASQWVKVEIRRGRKREVAERRRVLFPISLVSFDELCSWELFDSDLGEDVACELREYLIPDFSGWKDDKTFDDQFAKVLEGLRT